MSLRLRAKRIFDAVLALIAAPRPSENRARALTIDALYRIAQREQITPYAAEIRTLLPYRNSDIKALIWEIKYRRNPHGLALAAELLSEEIAELWQEAVGMPLLIPVPMHALRRLERGYNQTEMLCESILAKEAALRPCVLYAPQALVRHRMGIAQQKLPRRERVQNMKNAMRADPAIVRGRICIVLDDVATTGATLLECRRALTAAGAKVVHLLALAG